jgi:hypothetical protein
MAEHPWTIETSCSPLFRHYLTRNVERNNCPVIGEGRKIAEKEETRERNKG